MQTRPRRDLAAGVLAWALLVCGCRSERAFDEVVPPLPGPAPAEASGAAAPRAPEPEPVVAMRRLEAAFAPGGTPIAEAVDWSFREGQTRDVVLELSPSEQYVFIAYATPAGADLDLGVDGPDGLPLAEDRAPDEYPVIARFTPTRAGRHNLRMIAHRGSGEARFAAWAMPRTATGSTAEAMRRLRDRYAAGARIESPEHRDLLLPGASRVDAWAALPGCYALVASGVPGIRDLDVHLRTAEGSEIAEDVGPSPDVVLRNVCLQRPTLVDVELRAVEGSGEVVWQILRPTAPP